ncbi:MAG: phosphoribosylformylglycinamidine synthase subunit PurS [Aestuariivita sp.]|nr:phosphoribosylformylglycinamidine synthase subunit PurS [Aestuariivita sp.]
MKVRVHIMLKKDVLDPQGEAVRHALKNIGFDEVKRVRQGKVIDLEVDDGTEKNRIDQMCEDLLANTIIESYTIDME